MGRSRWADAARHTARGGAHWSPAASTLQAGLGQDGHQLTPAQHGFQQRGPVREEEMLGQEAQFLEDGAPGAGPGPALPPQVAQTSYLPYALRPTYPYFANCCSNPQILRKRRNLELLLDCWTQGLTS